ncbi:MAG: hypothetical protein AAF696_12930, partial [Bacteroidota bacterium]
NGPVTYTLRMLELEGAELRSEISFPLSSTLFFFRENIPTQQMMYPTVSPALKHKKTYAWQIEAWSGRKLLGKTEVWNFRLKQDKEDEPLVEGPFVRLKRKREGGHFLARNGVLKFEFEDKYKENELFQRISILDFQGKAMPIRQEQLNKFKEDLYALDLSTDSRLEHGQYYRMRLSDGKSQSYQVKFKYWIH